MTTAPFPDLEPMMREAKEKGLWWHCGYQDLWFSPAELEAEWAKGNFRWGAVNWKLRPPTEQEEYLRRCVVQAQAELEQFQKRMR